MNKSEQALIKLGNYKYLTKSQFMQLGFSKTYISKIIKDLESTGEIGVIKYAGKFHSDDFKREHIYYLKDKTAKELIAYGYKAQYPKSRKSKIGTDFRHRYFTVNCQLSCERWALKNGYSIDMWKSYFSNSDEFENATKIQYQSSYIVPDFITLMSGKKNLRFVGELTNGEEVKLAIDKINELKICAIDKLFTQYGWDKLPRVLCIMETENLKRLTIKRFNNEPDLQSHAPMFLFSTIKEVVEDFDNWVDTKGEMIKLSDL